MEIQLGTKIQKPVITQAECDAYSAVVNAILAHNEAAAAGDALWGMIDEPDDYIVGKIGIKPDPADVPEQELSLDERLTLLEAAQADADALNVDQAYRLTLLELGITE